MNLADWLRWVGPVVMAVVIIGGLWALAKHRLGKDSSISVHLSKDKRLHVLMAVLLTFGGALFYLFIALWLIPFYSIHTAMYWVLGVSFIAQVVFAWTPDTLNKDWRHRLHFIAASVVALSMITLLVFLSFSFYSLPPISAYLAVISMLLSLIFLGYFVASKGSLRNFLFYECFFIGLFALVMFFLAFGI